MSGAVVGTIGSVVGVVSGAVSVGNALFGGGGGNQVTAPAQQTSGGSGGGTAPFEGLSAFTTAGVHPNTDPRMGPGNPKETPAPKDMPIDLNAPQPMHKAASVGSTPSQPNFERTINQDNNGVWADRLSKYLDYNTRTLG